MMANGMLVRVLIHTDVTKYLYFRAVDGSYVFNRGKVLCHFPLSVASVVKLPLFSFDDSFVDKFFFIF